MWSHLDSISIHAPTNGATKRYHKNYTLIKISIHAPTNGATFVQWILEKVSRISIHAPTNGATTTSTRVIIVDLFQSTLRRTERPSCAARLVSPTFISIHAPTNGSTELCSNNQQPAAISIHAPTNGATKLPYLPPTNQRYFNPRSDERSDIL